MPKPKTPPAGTGSKPKYAGRPLSRESYAGVFQHIGVPEGQTILSTTLARMLNEVGGVPKGATVEDILERLQGKPGEFWSAWLDKNQGRINEEPAGPAGGSRREQQMREHLMQKYGLDAKTANNIPASQLEFQIREFKKLEENTSAGTDADRKEAERQKTLAQSRARNSRRGSTEGTRQSNIRRGAATGAVTTDKERAVTRGKDGTPREEALEFDSIDELSVQELEEALKKARVRDAVGSAATVRASLGEGSIDMSRLSGAVDGVEPFPNVPFMHEARGGGGAAAAGDNAAAGGAAVGGAAGGGSDGTAADSAEPARGEPFFKLPRNPWGVDVDDKGVARDRWLRSAARNAPRYLIPGAIAIGTGYGIGKATGLIGGGGYTDEEMDAAMQEGVSGLNELDTIFGTPQPRAMLPPPPPADMTMPPEDRIRSFRGTP